MSSIRKIQQCSDLRRGRRLFSGESMVLWRELYTGSGHMHLALRLLAASRPCARRSMECASFGPQDGLPDELQQYRAKHRALEGVISQLGSLDWTTLLVFSDEAVPTANDVVVAYMMLLLADFFKDAASDSHLADTLATLRALEIRWSPWLNEAERELRPREYLAELWSSASKAPVGKNVEPAVREILKTIKQMLSDPGRAG